VLSESNRMQSLVEDLLTLAKVDAHQLQLNLQDVDLEDVLDSEIKRLRTVYGLQVGAELQLSRVRGDERRLAQVFRNILDNAARHAKSTITIGLKRRSVEVVSRSTTAARSSVRKIEIGCSSGLPGSMPAVQPMAVGVGSVWRSVGRSWARTGER
jgi:signal transduction histidine kinase